MVENRAGSTSISFAAATRSGILFLLLLVAAVRAFAGTVTVTWDPETAPVSGYMVYYGSAAGSYPSKVDVGNLTSYTLSGLAEGATYHFAATAYDAAHVESGFSNDVATVVPSSTPVAQFSASTTTGTAPLALNFVNGSTGTITSDAWTFGDGTSSTAASPGHVYSAAGVYTVSLTVAGPGGSNTQTRSSYVTVTAAAPVAQFTASPLSGVAPLTPSVTNGSTGSITSYAWNFGDGTTSTAASPSHAYSTAGVYTVTLTVAGPGGSNTQTRSNYVTVTAPAPSPVPQFTASPLKGKAPLTTTFTSSSTGSITSYAWDFGDGTTSTAASPAHTYQAAGGYTVSLTVTGPGGSKTESRSNYVTVTPRRFRRMGEETTDASDAFDETPVNPGGERQLTRSY